MELDYLKKLKELETEFASSQRKAFAIVDLDKKPFYVCLNIFDNLEILNYQDNKFEITMDIMPKNKLGTALVDICSDFSNIENIIEKYIELCNKITFENSELVIETQIVTPLFLELGENNQYFNLLKDFEYKKYEEELKLFKKRKENISYFKKDTFTDISNSSTEPDIKQIFDDIIDTNATLKEYMNTQTIKSFTLDYLKTYTLEIKEIKKLVDTYFCYSSNSIYNNYDGIKKLFLFDVIENPINEFIFPTSKVEPKIKINDKYINVCDFLGKYLLKNKPKDKSESRRILLDYISKNSIKLFVTYQIHTIKELLIISFIEILKNNLTIRKCKNCGLYFIPESRSDEKYCNRISPQNPNKTCKEYGAKKTYRDEIKSTPIKYEHNKISQFYRMRINRAKNQKEKTKYESIFNVYKENYQKNKMKYKSGKLKETDFIEWIKNQRVAEK